LSYLKDGIYRSDIPFLLAQNPLSVHSWKRQDIEALLFQSSMLRS